MKFKYKFPEMNEYTMSNGMRIIWLEDHNHPVITISLQINIGRDNDPESFEGTSELLSNLMLKGTKKLSGDAFLEKFENAGASLFTDTKDEHSIFGVRMLKNAAEAIIPLFWDMVCNPELDIKEFKRLKKELLTGLSAEYSEPSSVGGKHFNAQIFGSTYPAGRNHSVTTVKKIKLNHIKKLYDNYFSPKICTLVIAGAMNMEEMRKKWESLFLQWDNDIIPANIQRSAIPVLSSNNIRIVNKPELTQTTLIIGHHTINELHKNKIQIAVANYILGGGNFSSRLMKRVRSEMGKTYGISSQLSCNKHHGIFLLSTATQNDQIPEMLQNIFEVYNSFVSEGPSEEELQKALQYTAGSLAFALEGLNNVVDKILWLRFFNRKNSYIENYESHLNPVTINSVRESLQNDFKCENFVITAVGKTSEITEHLEKYGVVNQYKCRSNPLS